ncbi:MAG TPA: dephospho-CoA kinase [Caulobacteraceae bacterium]
MIVLGLTGSIGMGKSTTARMFADEGAWVHDADQTVHRLYAQGGEAVGPVSAIFPEAVKKGAVDRQALAAAVAGDPEALKRLEAIVHPLVARSRVAFTDAAREAGAAVVVLDVPLLFETGGDLALDAVVVVSAPAETHRRRVLERPGMTPDRLATLLARQIPDADKRARADFIVETGEGLDRARVQVRQILSVVKDPDWRSRRALAGPGEASH